MIVASLEHLQVSHETLVWDLVSFQASFIVIDEAHEVVAEVDTIADFVAAKSYMVDVFEALSRHMAGMENGCPLS